MAEVIYPDVNSLWDALTADWGVAGSYGLLIEGLTAASTAAITTALGAEFDGTPNAYDVLVTGGIPVWPVAADPANNISMAQVLRHVFDDVTLILADVTAIAGDAMRGTDGAALVASGWDAALATELGGLDTTYLGHATHGLAQLDIELGLLVSSYLGHATHGLAQLDIELGTLATAVAGIPTVMVGTNGAALVASGWDAGLATILDNFSAANIGYLDRMQYHVIKESWFSNPDDIVALTQAASDDVLPDVVLPNISGTIDRVYLGFAIGFIENTNAAANGLLAAVNVRIKASAGAWDTDDIIAINLPDNSLMTAGSEKRAGVVFIGDNELSSEVVAFNDTYNIRIDGCTVDNDFLNLYDVQTFLIVVYH